MQENVRVEHGDWDAFEVGLPLLLLCEGFPEFLEECDLNLMLVIEEPGRVRTRFCERLTMPEAVCVETLEPEPGEVTAEEQLNAVRPVEIALPLSHQVGAAEVC